MGAGGSSPGTATMASVAAAMTTFVVVATLFVLWRSDPGVSIERRSVAPIALVGVAALVLLAAAAWASRSMRAGSSWSVLQVTVGVALPTWAGVQWLPEPARAASLGVLPLVIVGATASIAGAPAARRRTAVVAIAGVTAIAIHVGGYVPFYDPSCLRVCARTDALLPISTRQAVGLSAALVMGAALIATTIPFGSRVERGPAALLPLAAVWLVALDHVDRWRDLDVTSPSEEIRVLLPALSVLAITIPALEAWWHLRSARSEIARLTEFLAESGHSADLADPLVHVAVPGENRWLNRRGEEVPAAVDGLWWVVEGTDEPIARIRMGSRGPSNWRSVPSPMVRLALRNVQLVALANAHLAEAKASGAALVDALAAERHRIERDLHDGAQQRLVAASFHLNIARPLAGGAAELLEVADRQVHEALDQLRSIAQGQSQGQVDGRQGEGQDPGVRSVPSTMDGTRWPIEGAALP